MAIAVSELWGEWTRQSFEIIYILFLDSQIRNL